MAESSKDVKKESTDLSKNKSEQPRKRIPLGTRNILTAPKKPGFVRRFVNDKGDRIQAFKEAGWRIVENTKVGDDKLGKASSMGSGTNPHVGGNQRAVLMELPENVYIQDRAESQTKITKVENEIRRNQLGKDGLDGKVTIS